MTRTTTAALLALFVIALTATGRAAERYEPRDGDIVFQTSRSAQSLAIQRATRSPYSHMGIVFVRDGKPFVLEAVEPVKWTPLARWIERGERRHFVAKRLTDAEHKLTPDASTRLREAGEALLGTHYDLRFEWSDDKLYCSELVWKLYQRVLGIELGRLQTLSEFTLSDPVVQRKLQERWGGPPPADAVFISPASMFDSPLLATVTTGGGK